MVINKPNIICNHCGENLISEDRKTTYWIKSVKYELPKVVCISTEPKETEDNFAICEKCGTELMSWLNNFGDKQ